jgi:hypothetical protein
MQRFLGLLDGLGLSVHCGLLPFLLAQPLQVIERLPLGGDPDVRVVVEHSLRQVAGNRLIVISGAPDSASCRCDAYAACGNAVIPSLRTCSKQASRNT